MMAGIDDRPLLPPPDNELDHLLQRGWENIRHRARRPRCTYRVQLQPGCCGFGAATEIVSYLDSLGVSHLYVSPHLRCRHGSTHGYDVVDHGEINSELGTQQDLSALHETLHAHGMDMLLDWVPNHMAIGADNALWMNVLENGPSSEFAHFFDIDWKPVKTGLANKVLVPVLGDPYGMVLRRGELKLNYSDGVFTIRYFEHRFPVAPHSYARLLSHGRGALQAYLDAHQPEVEELDSIITAVHNLAPQTETDPSRLAEQRREKEVIKRRLAALVLGSPRIDQHVKFAVAAYNGSNEDPESFGLLHELLEMQAYRLAYWRVAAEQINYRRFFDINELAAIRMEDPQVFRQTHRLLSTWMAKGWAQAIRIDHPDGLYDPGEYFRRLQAEALLVACTTAWVQDERRPEAQERSWWESLHPLLLERCREAVLRAPRTEIMPLYIVAEKILARKERLPDSWAVSGTTGYDFLNSVNGLFIDRGSSRALDKIYARFIGHKSVFSDLVYRSKKLVLTTSMAAELQMLARQLENICEADYATRDITLGLLTHALTEVIACFPVYRTYIPQDESALDGRDRTYVDWAITSARQRDRTASPLIYDLIRGILLKDPGELQSVQTREARLSFLGKFQQVTSPAMAKGMEDTAFYVFNRLVSQNEVGGEPERMGTTVAEFHALNQERSHRAPGSLLSTATHDTKRGEDVRLRINVLSEMPESWHRHLIRWSQLNRRLRKEHEGRPAPDRNDEYLFYQVLLGAWPVETPSSEGLESFIQRMERYMVKACREAKVHTSWITSSPGYEGALASFIRGVLSRPATHPFWHSFLPLARTLSRVAMQSSLSQVLLKVVSPGVPDFYQGCEFWDLHLVDPDNRGPVDFTERKAVLDEFKTKAGPDADAVSLCRDLLEHPEDGYIKLFITWRSLSMRREFPELFSAGSYVALEAAGQAAAHVVSLARFDQRRTVVAVAGRLIARLLSDSGVDLTQPAVGARVWRDTRVHLPASFNGGRFRDRLTGQEHTAAGFEGVPCLDLARVLNVLPVALLEFDGTPASLDQQSPG